MKSFGVFKMPSSLFHQRWLRVLLAKPSPSQGLMIVVMTLMVLLSKPYKTLHGGEADLPDGTTPATEIFKDGGQQTPSAHLTKPILFDALEISPLLGSQETLTLVENKGRRIIFIGDIHGCIEELNELLAKVGYNKNKDHIITTGDMVNKGPDSAAVLELLRSHGASCVRGNHDDKTLHILQDMRRVSPSGSVVDVASVTNSPESAVALSLSSEQIAYLRACPIILHVGKLKQSELVVVHAGLVPSLPLTEQTASYVMNMRIIDVTTLEPSPKHQADGSLHWFELWNKYQPLSSAERHAFANNRHEADLSTITVIYGHDAKKGLQLHKYTRGLDTKCVVGGKLTALVVDENHDEEIVQVDCRVHHV